MSDIVIESCLLKGRVRIPSSKSYAHRMLLCAALSGGVSVIRRLSLSEDISATIDGVRALGAKVTAMGGGAVEVDATGLGTLSDAVSINCNESGSTLRFLIPMAAAVGAKVLFDGRGRLRERPLDDYLALMPRKGVSMTRLTGHSLPLRMEGQLRPGLYEIGGRVSSQYLSGLLMALPVLDGDSELRLTTPLESAAYVDMTLEVMEQFGVRVTPVTNGYLIRGGQRYRSGDFTVEGDWSQAAFFLAAGALGGDVTVEGLNCRSIQGDRAIEDILSRMGAELSWIGEDALRCRGGTLRGVALDMRQIPDLVPVVAFTAALAEGETHITGAGRLRYKESDRLKAVCKTLTHLKGKCVEHRDGLDIMGVKAFYGAGVDGFNDHRIVMSTAAVSAGYQRKNSVMILGADAVNKSYPDFFQDFQSLGGKCHVQ